MKSNLGTIIEEHEFLLEEEASREFSSHVFRNTSKAHYDTGVSYDKVSGLYTRHCSCGFNCRFRNKMCDKTLIIE